MKKTKKIETKPTRRPTKATKIVEAPEINEVEQNEVQASPKTSETKRKNLPMLLLATLALGLIGGYLLTQLYEEKQPAATVNGEVISMDTLNKELVRQGGQKVLENSVTETLIYQEAKKKNISADQKEIDQKIKDIENELKSKGQNMDNLLQSQGQTRDDLKKQIKIQILVEKMFGKDLAVTDKEAQEYFEKNKESYGEATYESKANEIKNGLKNQKLAEKFQSWLEDVKSKAKIKYYINQT